MTGALREKEKKIRCKGNNLQAEKEEGLDKYGNTL